VNIEERKMDHFKQGLRGNIRSMIAGQTFQNFQEMYQRAVKIAQVLEESENENRALNLGKRKMGSQQGGFGNRFQGGSYRQYRPNYPQDKGKQPMSKQGRPLCGKCKRHHSRPCHLDNIRCFGSGEVGYKMNDCPKAAWNQPRIGLAPNQQRPPNFTPQGRPPAPNTSQQPRNFKK